MYLVIFRIIYKKYLDRCRGWYFTWSGLGIHMQPEGRARTYHNLDVKSNHCAIYARLPDTYILYCNYSLALPDFLLLIFKARSDLRPSAAHLLPYPKPFHQFKHAIDTKSHSFKHAIY